MRKTSRSRRWRDRLTAVVAAIGVASLAAGGLVVGTAGAAYSVTTFDPTTTWNVTPYLASSTQCTTGTLFRDQFESFTDGESGGTVSDTYSVDGQSVTLTLTYSADNSFDFAVTGGTISRFDVKGGGGSDSLAYQYVPPVDGAANTGAVSADTGLHTPVVSQGAEEYSDVSHLDFCLSAQAPSPQTGSLTWLKHDEDDELLGGATFQVCYEDVTPCLTVEDNQADDEDSRLGAFKLTRLDLGTYVITETDAPNGYVAETDAETIELTTEAPANTAVIFVNQPIEDDGDGELAWLKYGMKGNSQESKALLDGATFLVCRVATSEGEPLERADCLEVTDNEGYDADDDAGEFLLVNLEYGEWTIDETAAPDHYRMDDSVETAVLTAQNPSNVDDPPEFVNKREGGGEGKAPLRWLKTDADGDLLGGATFEICRISGSGGSGHDDQGVTSDHEDGDDGNHQGGHATCLTVVDNAVETVVGQAPDVDPDDGEFQVDSRQMGTWSIEEITAPDGYVLDPDIELATLQGKNSGDVPVFVNEPIELRWLKHNGSGTLLGGATFQICLAGGDCMTVVDDGTLDVDKTPGEFELTKLSLGTWTIVELSAPAGYVRDSSTEEVVLTKVDPSNTDGTPDIPVFVNTRPEQYVPTGTLRWLKVDEEGDLLGGATFEVCQTGGTCVTVVDDSAPDVNADDGEFELRNLVLGTYTITEVEAPDGYVRDVGSETVVLSAGTPANTGDAIPEFVNLEEEDEVVYGDLGWLKVDQDEEPLGGATFEACHVVDINGNDLADDCAKVTDNKAPDTDPDAGELALADVPLGAWTIEETKAPKGYEMSDEVAEVVLTEADSSNIGDVDRPEFVNVLIDIEDEEEAEEPEVKPAEEERPKPAQPVKPAPVVQPDQVAGAEVALPTTVDAGLAGPTSTGGSNSPLGQSLMAAGLVLVALAGVMKAGRRERGVHEA